jgi:hypothetical protein
MQKNGPSQQVLGNACRAKSAIAVLIMRWQHSPEHTLEVARHWLETEMNHDL